MRLLTSTVIALIAALGSGLIAAPSNRPRDAKVIVTFADRPGDKIQDDHGGTYTDGVGNVVAYIATASNNGALIFSSNTQNTLGRTLQFSFDACLLVPTSLCTPPSTSLNESSKILGDALRNGTEPVGGMMGMAVGEELAFWAKIDIPLDSDPAYWNVCFDSRKAIGPCGAAPGGTSTDAHIRRDAADHWTIFANVADRADLVKDSQTNKKTRTFTLMGTYSMPFSFTVQCVNAADCL
jgi:hypothetical protein